MKKSSMFLWMVSSVSFVIVIVAHFLEWQYGSTKSNVEKGISQETEIGGVRGLFAGDVKERIPSDWQVEAVGREFGGWHQTGVAPICFGTAVEEVSAIMKECGYEESNRVSESSVGRDNLLVRYTRGKDASIMWMLWEETPNATRFSWGREKK